MKLHSRIARAIVGLVVIFCATPDFAFAEMRFEIRLAKVAEETQTPISGRVYVFLSQKELGDPMRTMNWFAPEPFFAKDVSNIQLDQSMVIDESSDSFPRPLSKLSPGEYRIQAILDHDFYYPNAAQGPGNIYSEVQTVTLDPSKSETIQMDLTRIVVRRELTDSLLVKYIELPSPSLSAFHGRPVVERAAVVLPSSYIDEPDRRYPVFYEVSGFGGTLAGMTARYQFGQPTGALNSDDVEFIKVMLTGECKWGHHVYANSATNGPRGDALVDEMILHIDATFRTVNDRDARFVGGHSSGGWSSLWLQVQYPRTFGGVWSSAPDPVDFRDWQGTNLYAVPVQSVFMDDSGNRRPVARRGNTPALMYDDFCKMDDCLKRGGQLRSFEAVFSPLDPYHSPKKCWDRTTGTLDPEVVEYWKRYDISLILEERWTELAPLLAGRIHIVMGDLDTFYLEGATKALAGRLQELHSDAEIEIVPGKDHGNLMTAELRQRRLQQMSLTFLEKFERSGRPRVLEFAK